MVLNSARLCYRWYYFRFYYNEDDVKILKKGTLKQKNYAVHIYLLVKSHF